MKYNLGCQLAYSIYEPSTFVFNIGVTNNAYQKIDSERIQIKPSFYFEEYQCPSTGNRYWRINASTGKLEISYQATVELCYRSAIPDHLPEVFPGNLSLEYLSLIFPSRYCQSDRLMNFALSEFGDLKPGYSRVMAICDWIYNKILYVSGSTNTHTSAYDTVLERVGVCRDFAHLGITFCRALNIPARFVTAYAYGLNPPDFHACFEAYLGQGWYLFDPTRLVPKTSIIRIGTGRDAADVSFATIFGSVEMNDISLFMEPQTKINTHLVLGSDVREQAIAIS